MASSFQNLPSGIQGSFRNFILVDITYDRKCFGSPCWQSFPGHTWSPYKSPILCEPHNAGISPINEDMNRLSSERKKIILERSYPKNCFSKLYGTRYELADRFRLATLKLLKKSLDCITLTQIWASQIFLELSYCMNSYSPLFWMQVIYISNISFVKIEVQ